MQADELKALRKQAGMTQADLAENIGMSRKQIVEMEAGRAPIEKRTDLAVRYVIAAIAPDVTDYDFAAHYFGCDSALMAERLLSQDENEKAQILAGFFARRRKLDAAARESAAD